MRFLRNRKNQDDNSSGARQDTIGSIIKAGDISRSEEYKCRICIDLGYNKF